MKNILEYLKEWDEPLNEGLNDKFKKILTASLLKAMIASAIINPAAAGAAEKEINDYVNEYVGKSYTYEPTKAPDDIGFYVWMITKLKNGSENVISEKMNKQLAGEGLTNKEVAKILKKEVKKAWDDREYNVAIPADVKQLDDTMKIVDKNSEGMTYRITNYIKKLDGIKKNQKYFDLEAPEFIMPLMSFFVYADSVGELSAILSKCDENHPKVAEAQEFLDKHFTNVKAFGDALNHAFGRYYENFRSEYEYLELIKILTKIDDSKSPITLKLSSLIDQKELAKPQPKWLNELHKRAWKNKRTFVKK